MFKPVAMIGGDQASREPWRNLYAHLCATLGWAEFATTFGELELCRYLEAKPRTTLDDMIGRGLNSPPASSCGRLFDAVAAALGICRDRQLYEGEAAARLEALVDEQTLREADDGHCYPFTIAHPAQSGPRCLGPADMWKALLRDLLANTPAPVIAARFHRGLARGIVAMVQKASHRPDGPRLDTVALSGGCFQNAVLFGEVVQRLLADGFTVLSHRQVPANDGGLALGQGVVAAARLITGLEP